MSDDLADRLKHLAAQHAKSKHAEENVQALQERVNKFISDNARPEYDKLVRLMRERVDKVNPTLGTLPQYRMGNQQVGQGNMAAYVIFDKPIMNMPNNQLIISLGPGPNTRFDYVFGPPPEPVRYRMQAAAANDFSQIVWTGDLGELTSEQLVDLVLEQLTTYYLDHQK